MPPQAQASTFSNSHPSIRSLLYDVNSSINQRLHRTQHDHRLQRLRNLFANGNVRISLVTREFSNRQFFGIFVGYRFTTIHTTRFQSTAMTTEAYLRIRMRAKRGWVDRISEDEEEEVEVDSSGDETQEDQQEA